MNTINLNESFGTLLETINGLVKLGYNHDFNIKEDCIVCRQANITLSPEDFQIDKTYRFEGDSDPDYQSILYAISSPKFGIKGLLVTGYGISADEASSKLIAKLQTNNTLPIMKNKSNEATPQRPEGNRVLNAQLVEMDLNKFIDQIKNEVTWKNSDRNSVTIFKSETMRIVIMGLHEDAELKSHKVNGVISIQTVEGKINLVTAQQSVTLEKGQMIALEENVLHSVTAIKESFFLLTLAMNNK